MKTETVAMILAGGQGSRLGKLTENIAKPAVSFGGNYRMIDFALSNCANSNINTVGVITQYRPLALNDHVGNGSSWGLNRHGGGATILQPYSSVEGEKFFEGTSHAIYQNMGYIDLYDPEYVVVLSGDHIYKMDYEKMVEYHKEKNALLTIAVREVPWEEASRFGIMNTDDTGRIVEFEEKPEKPKSNLASMGVYVFSWKRLKKYLSDAAAKGKEMDDFGHDVIPAYLRNSEAVYAYSFDGYWKDVGTIESLWESNMEFLDPQHELNIRDASWRIFSKSYNTTPQQIAEDAEVTDSMVTDGCYVAGKVKHSILGHSVKIGKNSVVKDSVIMPNAVIGENVYVEKAIIGENARLYEGAQVIGREGAIEVVGNEERLEARKMKNKYAVIFNLVEESDKLLPLTDRRPVATLPIASRYRLIDFPFSSLSNAQVRSASLFISGSGRSLYDHVRAGKSWGLDNVTGGGIFTHSQIRLKSKTESNLNYYQDHREYLAKSDSKYVVLLGSNILANLSIDSMLAYHLEEANDITVAYKSVPRNELREDTIFSRYIFSENHKKRIDKIQPLSDLALVSTEVMFGLNVMITEKESFMRYLDEVEELNQLVSVENILNVAKENPAVQIGGYEYTGYLKAIEDHASYFAANMDMLDEEKFNALFYRESPVLTKSKNSAPSYYGKESKVKNSLLANDCEIYGTVENSVIFRKSFICEKAKINHSVILQGSYVDEHADLNYVILDKRVHVEKGVKLEGTAENPIVVPKDSRVLSSGEIVEG